MPRPGPAHPVRALHRAGRHRALDPAAHPGNAGVPQARRGAEDRAGADRRSMPQAVGDHLPRGAGAHLGAGPVLHLHRLHLRLRPHDSSCSPSSLVVYAPPTLRASRVLLLAGVLAAPCLAAFAIPFSGYLSDRIGRKKMYIIGAAAMGVWGFVYFGPINTGAATLIFVAMMFSLIAHDMQYGPQAALI